jgi:hypothetical protein
VAKFYGTIGYAETTEIRPGVWDEQIVERNYYCELGRNKRMLQSADHTNDDINIANEISIIADPYANGHYHAMRYIIFNGAKWKISSVDATTYPRLSLTVGGLYNG